MIPPSDWPERLIRVEDALLDWRNPRLLVDAELAQPDLLKELIARFDVLGLCRSIVSAGGFYKWDDTIICTEEKDGLIVLEGNRRVAAAKCIVNPSEIPSAFKELFQPLNTEKVKKKVAALRAIIAPSRDAALPYLVLMHTQDAKLSWKSLAKYKFVYDQFQSGKSIATISNIEKVSANQVKVGIRNYEIYKLIRSLGWEAHEIDRLRADGFEPYKMIAFLEKSKTKSALQMNLGHEYGIKSDWPDEQFRVFLRKLVFDFLIAETADSRTAPEEYFSRGDVREIFPQGYVLPWEIAAGQPGKPSASIPGEGGSAERKPGAAEPADRDARPTPGPQRADRREGQRRQAWEFFEGIHSTISGDIRLNNYLVEISDKGILKFPNSAVLLMRSLLEHCLCICIRQARKWPEFMKYVKPKHSTPKFYTLTDLIEFCLDASTGAMDSEQRKYLNTLNSQKGRELLNWQVHDPRARAAKGTVTEIAVYVRPVIESIINPFGE